MIISAVHPFHLVPGHRAHRLALVGVRVPLALPPDQDEELEAEDDG